MQVYIDSDNYSFDDFQLSVGKIHFHIENKLFPEKQWSCFTNLVLLTWVEGLIQLVETREEGLYEFSFENETHKWIIDYEGNDEHIVNQFLESREIIHVNQYSLIEILDAIIPAILDFLDHCKQQGWENDELKDLKKRIPRLQKDRKTLD